MIKLIVNYKNTTPILIFCISLIIFTIGINQQEIVGFETRFYLFALEMIRNGYSWFPTTYSQPYPDYPGLSTVLITFFAKIFGVFNKQVAILPSAIAASITSVFTYLIARIHSKNWAFASVCFLFLTYAFITQARTISLDLYIAMITSACFYLLYSAKMNKTEPKLFLLLFLITLGFAFRGPIGLVIPTGVSCLFFLIEKNYKSFFKFGILSLMVLAACFVFLIFISKQSGGESFVANVIRMQMSGRLGESQSPPIYYYLRDGLGMFAITFPLTVALSIALLFDIKKISDEDKKFLLHLIGWIFIILFGMSIPGDKKIRYVLSITPALAIFCGYLFKSDLMSFHVASVKKILLVFFIVCPSLLLNAFYLMYHHHPDFKTELPLTYYYGFLIALQVLAFLFYRRDRYLLLFACTAFLSIYILIVEPVQIAIYKSHDFISKIENLRQHNQIPLIFYKEDKDGLPIKYLANANSEIRPMFVCRFKDFFNYKKGIVILNLKDKPDFVAYRSRFKQELTGKIGTSDIVVLSLISSEVAI